MRQSWLLLCVYATCVITSSTFAQTMTDADAARLLREIEPMVEAVTGRSYDAGVTISFVDAETHARTIEQGLK